MNTTAEVYLWGTRIGIIHQDLGKPYASFEYDKEFIKSGIELSPITMPLKDTIYEFPSLSNEPFYGLPGLVADSLPDDFGNKVIEKWLISQDKSIEDFTSIDRLCYTGKRGMGALEYKPVSFDIKDINENINVSKMVEFASEVLSSREKVVIDSSTLLTYSQLVQVGTSAGGARAKALIAWNEKTNEIRSGQINLGKDYDYWIMKFDNVKNNGDYDIIDPIEYTLIEYSYYLMAIDAGIKMNECRIYSNNGENHFMTKRFDRVNGKKLHMLSLGAIGHISYKEPCQCSYELAVQYMKKMGLPMSDIEQFYRRMVFNCMAINYDDHVKNTSFLMDRNGKWSLSPAYDLTFAYNKDNRWLKAHQMTINNKNIDITIEDLLLAGKNMGLNKRKCENIIKDVNSVVLQYEQYALKANIKIDTYKPIKEIIDKNIDYMYHKNSQV